MINARRRTAAAHAAAQTGWPRAQQAPPAPAARNLMIVIVAAGTGSQANARFRASKLDIFGCSGGDDYIIRFLQPGAKPDPSQVNVGALCGWFLLGSAIKTTRFDRPVDLYKYNVV